MKLSIVSLNKDIYDQFEDETMIYKFSWSTIWMFVLIHNLIRMILKSLVNSIDKMTTFEEFFSLIQKTLRTNLSPPFALDK